MTKVSFPL